MNLLDDLRAAMPGPDCTLCAFIQSIEDEETKQALNVAAEGMIGRDTLAKILRSHGTGIGSRTIVRHRQEGHKP